MANPPLQPGGKIPEDHICTIAASNHRVLLPQPFSGLHRLLLLEPLQLGKHPLYLLARAWIIPYGWVWSHPRGARSPTSQSLGRERNIVQLHKVFREYFLTTLRNSLTVPSALIRVFIPCGGKKVSSLISRKGGRSLFVLRPTSAFPTSSLAIPALSARS